MEFFSYSPQFLSFVCIDSNDLLSILINEKLEKKITIIQTYETFHTNFTNIAIYLFTTSISTKQNDYIIRK